MHVICSDWLPTNTMMVSKDLFELMKNILGEMEQDNEFLKGLGVKIDGDDSRRPPSGS